MDGFTTMTAAGMLRSDLSIVTILDTNRMPSPLGSFRLSSNTVINKLDFYSRFENIKGGVLEIDPTMYEGNKGKVYFSNDKPFVSVKRSLWYHTDIRDVNEAGEEAKAARQEYMKKMADTVNAYRSDINSINGYSIINIHPWSIPMSLLVEWVALLNDHIVLVSAEELIEMVAANVPHRPATPRR